MAYNYSPWFLTSNESTVRWLVDLAKARETGHKSFQSWQVAKKWRETILSLLACLAYNHPDMAWVKNGLRTWIDRTKDGLVLVYVGTPDKPIRGPKPKAVETGVSSGSVLEIREILGSQEMRAIAAVLIPDSGYEEIRVQVPPPPEGVEYIRGMRNEFHHTYFEVLSVEPHLRLRRRHEEQGL